MSDHAIGRVRAFIAEHRNALATGYCAHGLTHGDFRASNVLVEMNEDEGQVTGIIGAERCASGDPWWDLTTFELSQSDSDQKALDAFFEGYGGRGDPDLARTRLLILMLREPEQNLPRLKAMDMP